MDDKVKKVLLKSLLPKNFVSTDEALELAIDEGYDLSDLQNFYYEITGKENI